MPAIHIERLKEQVADLATLFDNPTKFSKALLDLFELYADRTHRPGQSGKPPPLIKPFNVPSPVLSAVVTEILPQVDRYPNAALELCDHLWQEPYLEFRLVSIKLLGNIKSSDPNPIIARVSDWIHTELEETIINAILDDGLANIRAKAPDIVLKLIDNWFNSQDTFLIKSGMLALKHLITNSEIEDTAGIFRLLNPYIRISQKQFRPDVLTLLRTLAEHNPKEAAYFFRMNMDTSYSDDTAWFIRQSIHDFPDDIQNKLRIYLRGSNITREL